MTYAEKVLQSWSDMIADPEFEADDQYIPALAGLANEIKGLIMKHPDWSKNTKLIGQDIVDLGLAFMLCTMERSGLIEEVKVTEHIVGVGDGDEGDDD